MKFLNRKNIFFFVLSLIHFFIVFKFTFPTDYSLLLCQQKIIFIIYKIVSFIFIVGLWQFIVFIFNSIKERNAEKLSFIKYFIIYFLLNMFVLYLTYPLMITENSLCLSFVDLHYGYLTMHPSLFQFLNIAFFYHVIPSMVGVSICNSFCFSLIFAYIITSVKKIVKSNWANLLFIPFCFPFVLALNQCPQRLIPCAWLFIFVLSFIFFNQKKIIKDNIKILLFALVSSFLLMSRSEYIILLVFLPFIIYLLKVVDVKRCILYSFVLFLMFFSYNFIVKSQDDYHYELHNLSYIYDDYFLNDIPDKDIEKNSLILKKVYKNSFEVSDLPSTSDAFDMSDKEEVNVVISTLTKFAFKNANHFIKKNMALLNFSENDIFRLHFEKEQVKRNWLDSPEKLYIDLNEDNPRFEKITSFILNLNINNKASNLIKFVYSPINCAYLLILIFVFALVQRRYFYVFISLLWLIIFLLTLIFMKWIVSLYFFALILNTWYLFFLYVVTMFQNKKERV